MKEDLSNKNIDFTYLNILSDLKTLKEYLHYRDNLKEFEEIKKNQKLGIPLVIMEKNSETKIFISPDNADFLEK